MNEWERIHYQELARRCHEAPTGERWTWRTLERPRRRLQLVSPLGEAWDFRSTAAGMFLRKNDDASVPR